MMLRFNWVENSVRRADNTLVTRKFDSALEGTQAYYKITTFD